MHRCIIFVASLFLAFVAISSASTANPSDWKRVADDSTSTLAQVGGGGDEASWMTVPSPGLATFVLIRL
jgi:hypothetical protein